MAGLDAMRPLHFTKSWVYSQRKSSFPETKEKVRRLKRKNAELAVIAKRLEERAHKLQEANLLMVRARVWGDETPEGCGAGGLEDRGTMG